MTVLPSLREVARCSDSTAVIPTSWCLKAGNFNSAFYFLALFRFRSHTTADVNNSVRKMANFRHCISAVFQFYLHFNIIPSKVAFFDVAAGFVQVRFVSHVAIQSQYAVRFLVAIFIFSSKSQQNLSFRNSLPHRTLQLCLNSEKKQFCPQINNSLCRHIVRNFITQRRGCKVQSWTSEIRCAV